MNRRQGYIIIALLAVIAVALAVLIGVLVGSRGDDQGAAVEQDQPPTSSTEAATDEITDPAAALEEAGFDVVMPAPVPDAPEAWGDYQLDGSWNGQVRVFEGGDAVPVDGETGGKFPASQNSCGTEAYFVTFRTVGEGVQVDAQLVNAVGEPADSEIMTDGWMLGTNCVTPSFAFHSSEGGGTLTEVAYSVHRYRQASVAGGAGQEVTSAAPAPAPAPTPVVPATPAAPTLVECESGLSALGMFSDGVRRQDMRCHDPRASRAEGVCGGMYGWEKVSREEYIELCGVEPPTGR